MLRIDPQKETEKIVDFIRNTLKKQGFKRLVLGLSGGVDSSTCAFLVARALGPRNLYILLAPYKNQDMSLAKKVIQKIKIPSENVVEIDITSPVNNFINKLDTFLSKFTPACCDRNIARLTKKKSSQTINNQQLTINNIAKGNLIARVRMIITFDMAKRLGALVCGTENRSEYLLGYFTRYGDSASDIEPIRHLYKTQVWQLAKYLGVPREIIEAKPTASLWRGQTDEGELGFFYKEADIVLHLLFDKKMAGEGIAKFISPHRRLKSATPKIISPEIVKKVLKRVKENLFKHKVPYTLPSSY